ncbi:hypothetical protein [Indiicoccus explosivorum]|nr:hypothetical protein [Indiicoccus explosivorum]
MKFGKIMKTAMKYGPIVYPVVKKALDKRKRASKSRGRTRTVSSRRR